MTSAGTGRSEPAPGYARPPCGGSPRKRRLREVEGELIGGGRQGRRPPPWEMVHEDPGAAVDRARSPRLERGLVARAGVSLVELEVVDRVVLGLGPHDPVTRDLGEDRRGGDRQTGRVAFDDPTRPALADEVPRSVDQDLVGLEAEGIQGPTGGELLGS